MQDAELILTQCSPNLEALWKEVFHEGVKIEKAKGNMLRENEEKKLYFLYKGEVNLLSVSMNGKERLLGQSKAPALLCEESVLSDNTCSYTLIVCNTPCTLYAFSKAWVHTKLLAQHPELTYTLLQSLASKTIKLLNQRVFLRSENIPSLICAFLQQHRVQEGEKIYAKPLLSQIALASFLGVHPVSLNKALKKLSQQGVIGKYHKDATPILNEELFLSYVENGRE